MSVEARFDALEAYIEASEAETRRHMDAIGERLTADIAGLAEAINTLGERLSAEIREGFGETDRRLLRLEASQAPKATESHQRRAGAEAPLYLRHSTAPKRV
jgi:hypothetical protein